MVEVPCLRSGFDIESDSAEERSRSRRLHLLREQLVRENRRSTGPFSHPLATRGSLWRLREQIRDVSRIADAIAISAESANAGRLNELCSDLRRLLQTQQRWTERLENQIWRLESQATLMCRLQQVLQQNSPGTDQIWELCELIARETQAIPDGLLLLPEPGQKIAVPADQLHNFAASSIEHARWSVFAAMSLLPDVRGADLVAGALQATASGILNTVHLGATSDNDLNLLAFAERLSRQTPARDLSVESRQLIASAAEFMARVEAISLSAVDNVVPPGISAFYESLSELPQASGSIVSAIGLSMPEICGAFGLTTKSLTHCDDAAKEGDERIVLTHKLRWHDGARTDTSALHGSPSVPRARRPHFTASSAERPKFNLVSD